jgi:hypothetical protein
MGPNKISAYNSAGGDIWLNIGARHYMKIDWEHAYNFFTKQQLHITFLNTATMLIFEVKFDRL